MNIFFIPSWYPSKSNPTSGLFIKEQVSALGKHSNSQFIISLWGDEETKLNFEYPGQVLSHLNNYFQNKPYQRKIAQNVWEFNQPALEWSARLFRGNINSILKANIQNFQKSQKKFGKIDLIHAHVSFPAGFVAMKLSEQFKLPYIITEHMGPFPLEPFRNNKKLLALVIEPLKKADRVIVVSQKLKDELSGYRIDSTLIPNLVNENYFKPVSKPPRTFGKFIFFTLSEQIPEKGIADLLEAIALATKKESDIFFRIGGKGEYLKKYQKMAKDLGIESKVKFLGLLSRPQVLREFSRGDSFILPSHHESFGMVFLEALACGKPVIATRCGGPEDFVGQKNGLLVEVGEIDQIARAILKMKQNSGQFDPEKIRKNILKKYSSRAVCQKIFALYGEII